MTPTLALSDVTVRYPGDAGDTLAGVSLELAPGEQVALVGLNGSGKTTLLLATAGLVPHSGEIRVCGVTLSPRNLSAVRERIGFLFNVPEDQLLFPRVVDDVAFGPLRRGVAPAEALGRAGAALAALGVADLAELPLHHLSHGQKQRVALAGALVTDPPLLLLDEPSAGLDPPGRRELAAHLSGLGAAALVATHDLDFAGLFCSRYVLLERGRVVLDEQDPGAVARRWALS